jgi:hypothetical protein
MASKSGQGRSVEVRSIIRVPIIIELCLQKIVERTRQRRHQLDAEMEQSGPLSPMNVGAKRLSDPKKTRNNSGGRE